MTCHINTVGTIVEENGVRIETYEHDHVRVPFMWWIRHNIILPKLKYTIDVC